MYNILICDDEKDIVNAIKIYLSTQPDYNLFTAYNGFEALKVVEENPIHLVLLDIMMPQMDGLETLRRLRVKTNVPVILLTAKSETYDKVLGLNSGADDYITKPFEALEVLARVKSHLRRFTSLGAKPIDENVISIGGIVLNDDQKRVLVDGEEITLTPTEYGILKLLMRNPGIVFSSEQIYESVWNENSIGNERSVAVHIRHLREKIEYDSSNPHYLKVVWGQGYKFEKQ